MNDILKQRLVGALILVALGVVFWPIIFVEPGGQSAAEQDRIPAPPGVPTTPLDTPDMAGLRTSPPRSAPPEPEPEPAAPVSEPVAASAEPDTVGGGDKAETTAAPAEKKPAARTRDVAPEKLVLDSDGIPVAWILQVASVSSKDKAEELRQRLVKTGETVDVKKVKAGGKVLYRVYIGPKIERARLEKMQPGINAEFGVQSVIVRFIP